MCSKGTQLQGMNAHNGSILLKKTMKKLIFDLLKYKCHLITVPYLFKNVQKAHNEYENIQKAHNGNK